MWIGGASAGAGISAAGTRPSSPAARYAIPENNANVSTLIAPRAKVASPRGRAYIPKRDRATARWPRLPAAASRHCAGEARGIGGFEAPAALFSERDKGGEGRLLPALPSPRNCAPRRPHPAAPAGSLALPATG